MKTKEKVPSFNEIIFKDRNKDYGAYVLRKKYSRNVLIGLLIGVVILSAVTILPYLNAKAKEERKKIAERSVEIKMENLDQPAAQAYVPPPPPPPPAEVIQQNRYVPPVVVDSIKPEENIQLMTADQAQLEVKNEDVTIEVVQQAKEEVQEAEPEIEPFIVVEEMPTFPGGDAALFKFVSDNLKYPPIAQENNVQGRVIIKFCVTPTGGVDKIQVVKGVDTELDKEAVRVVSILPKFNPGKQGGKPVPVWYTIPINFILKQ